MDIAIFAFLVVFLLIASAGLLLFYREAMIQRVSAVITPGMRRNGWRSPRLWKRLPVGEVVGHFERILPKSKAEVSVTRQRLIRAGYRDESAVNLFYGAKVVTPIVLCLLALMTGLGRHDTFFVYALALVLGFLAPDFWLGRRISVRQKQLRLGLPDALDLLVICIEAGQSLDQATARTAEELRRAHPAISDELGVVVLEQRAGVPRTDAWKRFVERTAVDTVRGLVAVLIQSEQFGTSVAKTLRTHSDTLRTQRRQKVEEQAAKTSVKLVFPLVFFIFPSLFVVTLGPAVITMLAGFHKYLMK